MKYLQLKIPPLLLMLLFAFLIFGLDRLLPAFRIAHGGREIIVAVFTVAALLIIVAGIYGFRKARTTVNPTAPTETSTIVTSGIYRFSRNPMYLGFLLLLLAWALYITNIVAFIAVPAFIAYLNKFQISAEETILADKFGADYEQYCRRTRRWI